MVLLLWTISDGDRCRWLIWSVWLARLDPGSTCARSPRIRTMHLRVSTVGPTCSKTNVGWGSRRGPLILKSDSWNGLCAGEGEKDHTSITMPWFAIYSWSLPWPLRNRKYSLSILCSTDVDVAGSAVDGFCLLLLTRMPLIKLWLEANISIINIHWCSPL